MSVTCGSGTFTTRLGSVDSNNQGTINAVNVTVAPTTSADAVINVGDHHAIVLRNGYPSNDPPTAGAARSTISVGTAGNITSAASPIALVTSHVTTNTGDPTLRADVNPGRNTIEFDNNYDLIVWANGEVTETGPATRAEAVQALGTNNTITNYGLIENTMPAPPASGRRSGSRTSPSIRHCTTPSTITGRSVSSATAA